MTGDLLLAVGGIGLFLVGMIMLTEGLKGLAGRALRRVLARFTATPLSGAVTGALTTAVVQSSSATTVTAVGFVGAGLITFPQALGIIFGANLGTTTTGWLVALLGFKLQLGAIALPMVFAAALMRLFGSPRLDMLGTALAGFSLLFIGIDAMREGLNALEGTVTPADFPGDTLIGRLQLLLIGAAVTAVTQSSSAGVAAALAALGAGTINFPQAAVMVIGMNVGTTLTALIATLGGSAAMRRTGYAHLIFNLVTGFVAFLLLGPFTAAMSRIGLSDDGLIAVVTFHTVFNLLGVVLFLPFAEPFAGLITRLVRERGPTLTRRLGKPILRDPDAATDAAAATAEEIARAHFAFLDRRLGHGRPSRADVTDLRDIADALAATRDFTGDIAEGASDHHRANRIAAALHMLDHMLRLYYRCTQTERLATMGTEPRLRRLRGIMRSLAAEAAVQADPAGAESRLNKLRRILRRQRELYRNRTITLASTGRLEDEAALLRLDAVRWLQRVAYHMWRIQHHMNRMRHAAMPASPRREAAVEVAQD